MEYAAFLAVVAGLLFIFILTGKMEEKKARQFLRNRLQKQYGTYSDKQYADGRMESMKSGIRCAEERFRIDDITWNDLEMDRVFRTIDFTRSSAGEEALYRWLRIPEFDGQALSEREKHFRFFETHEKDRLDYLMLMSEVGRTGKYSVYDYLDYLEALPEKNCLITKVLDVLMTACLVLGIAVNGYFFVPAVGLLLYHMLTYMQQKKEVEPYLMTFSYFVRILDSVKKLHRMSDGFQQEFEKEIAQIQREKAELAAFRRFSFLALDYDAGSTPMDITRIILSYFNMIFHLDLLKLYSMLHVIKEKKQMLIMLLRHMGEIESCISVVYARAAFGEYTEPKLIQQRQDEICMETEEMFHPLLQDPVKNSFCQRRGMLLTGSNASGKSTFLKTVALNALFAQTIHTVCARTYRAGYFRIYSSMALRDSLQQGESYFIVEIKSMKRIFDAAEKEGAPVLCTIDEILRGTNTAERIGAGTELLKALCRKGVLCFAATHDLELTVLLKEDMDNYHFEEWVKGKEIQFPYQLTEGCATGRNAIKLLGALGFDQELVQRAEKLAGGMM